VGGEKKAREKKVPVVSPEKVPRETCVIYPGGGENMNSDENWLG